MQDGAVFVGQHDGTAERIEGFGHPRAHDGADIEHLADSPRAADAATTAFARIGFVAHADFPFVREFGLRGAGAAASTCSIIRRIAIERGGLSSWRAAQASMAARNSGERRIAVTGSCPVAGRPLFFRTTAIDLPIFT